MKHTTIRDATLSDKIPILKFCQNTFSWGDYVEHVWDFWLSEGYLFLAEKPNQVGICHAFYSLDQIWIEGIRIHPEYRRQKIASDLVIYAENIGKEKHVLFSYMLIDTKNAASFSMANSLDYNIFQTWNFYSLDPKINLNHNVSFEYDFDHQLHPQYVQSWRWLPLDDMAMSLLTAQNRIVKSTLSDDNSFAIITDSDHFNKTLIVTLFSYSDDSALQVLSFLQNYAMNNNYERIQILTKEELPLFDSLDYKISFHLMKKSLT